jgi:hypothetical protein
MANLTLFAPFHRFGSGSFCWPTSTNTSPVSASRDVVSRGQETCSNGLPVHRQVANAPLVVCLLNRCFPSHIAGFITSVVLYATDRVFSRWALTDLEKKCGEIMDPFRADRDSSSAVVGVGLMTRLQAAFLDLVPSSVFWCATHSVRAITLVQYFRKNTAATAASAIAERSGEHNSTRAAIAPAIPVTILRGLLDHDPAPVSVAIHAVIISGINPMFTAVRRG